MLSFAERKQELATRLSASRGREVALGKPTSNLFRDRHGPRQRLDVSSFDHVLAIDPAAGWVDVEGMTPYDAIAEATLQRSVMPCVVPQLKSITIGGAVAGVGIESSSFRYGLVHDTLLELEVLLADGSVVICNPHNEHKDLFFGFPNSYGTLGYALRVRTRVVPVQPYVKLRHIRFADAHDYFAALARCCDEPDVDFIDGTVMGARELYLTLGRFSATAPYTSDYKYEHIYYRSIAQREEDYLTISDYLWRWDTDWFWCSKNLGAQNSFVRRLLGPQRLNSRFYTKVMRWNSRWRLTHLIDRLSKYRYRESVIQDVDIPVERAAEFLEFFLAKVDIRPIWICPIRSHGHWTLYPMQEQKLYVNFGFWDVVRRHEAHAQGSFNRMIEDKVCSLSGIKSLYSESYYEPDAFWGQYNGVVYRQLKQRYDPRGAFKDLYAKCVLRQ
jgi:FAD/FMN-containing dehydrogenase